MFENEPRTRAYARGREVFLFTFTTGPILVSIRKKLQKSIQKLESTLLKYNDVNFF